MIYQGQVDGTHISGKPGCPCYTCIDLENLKLGTTVQYDIRGGISSLVQGDHMTGTVQRAYRRAVRIAHDGWYSTPKEHQKGKNCPCQKCVLELYPLDGKTVEFEATPDRWLTSFKIIE